VGRTVKNRKANMGRRLLRKDRQLRELEHHVPFADYGNWCTLQLYHG
jgi:hypothetical protein